MLMVNGQLDLKRAMRRVDASSTHLEVLAVCMAIRAFAKPNTAVLINCDSKAAVFTLIKRYCKTSEYIQGVIISLDKVSTELF